MTDPQDKCNEAVGEMNDCIYVRADEVDQILFADGQDFLKSTQATEVAAQLFANYSASVKYNLAAVNKMPPPK